MFDLPEEYKMNKRIAMKGFIPSRLKPDTKRKIKDCVKKVILTYQITGEEIPSVINDTYNYSVIQFFDFELTDIKKANFIAGIYQEIIKSPCVLRFYDTNKEIYSFGLKRLNQNDSTEIVLIDDFLTGTFQLNLPDRNKETFLKTISYPHLINKTNKVNYYLEMYVKMYILHNEKVYAKAKDFFEKPLWYDEDKIRNIYNLFKTVVCKKEELIKATTNAEKMKINQCIKGTLLELDKI